MIGWQLERAMLGIQPGYQGTPLLIVIVISVMGSVMTKLSQDLGFRSYLKDNSSIIWSYNADI